MKVRPLDPTLTLPNPWSLPAKLGFPGLFVDSLHGYKALAREFSRSSPINRQPDGAGLLWLELKPSATSGIVMRNEFNDGLRVKAGFAAEGGWLKELEITYRDPAAVLKLSVVEQTNHLSEADVADFGIPDEVMEAVEALTKTPAKKSTDAATGGDPSPPTEIGKGEGAAPDAGDQAGE